jgi:hypothetical protein
MVVQDGAYRTQIVVRHVLRLRMGGFCHDLQWMSVVGWESEHNGGQVTEAGGLRRSNVSANGADIALF